MNEAQLDKIQSLAEFHTENMKKELHALVNLSMELEAGKKISFINYHDNSLYSISQIQEFFKNLEAGE